MRTSFSIDSAWTGAMFRANWFAGIPCIAGIPITGKITCMPLSGSKNAEAFVCLAHQSQHLKTVEWAGTPFELGIHKSIYDSIIFYWVDPIVYYGR